MSKTSMKRSSLGCGTHGDRTIAAGRPASHEVDIVISITLAVLSMVKSNKPCIPIPGDDPPTKHGLHPLVASEPQYSLPEQGTTYIPGSASISGLVKPRTFAQVVERMNPRAVRVYACSANLERLERAAALEERKGSSHRPDRAGAPTHRPRSPGERFADNAGALLISFTAAEPAWLDLETDTLP